MASVTVPGGLSSLWRPLGTLPPSTEPPFLEVCHSWVWSQGNALDLRMWHGIEVLWKARLYNNQRIPKNAGDMWAITRLAFIPLATHGYSQPEGRRTGERMSHHANEAVTFVVPSVRTLGVFQQDFLFLCRNVTLTGSRIRIYRTSYGAGHHCDVVVFCMLCSKCVP